jgi:beta-N-acetylhexosaminidase
VEHEILRKLICTAIFLLLLLFMNAGAVDFWDPDGSYADQASEITALLDDSELLGQVLMLGYLGSEPSDEFLQWIREWNIGGVKVFGWNTGNLRELASGIAAMQHAAVSAIPGIPLFIATDQEGGWVRHVKGETSETPGNLAIGASGIAMDAYKSGYYIGRELRVLGINMNFAPTVDIYSNPNADVIGPRSFSSDPVEAAFLSVAFFQGQEEAGVISTAKHFPGHGNAGEDSHGTLPVVGDSFDTIWEIDLLPYRFLIKEGLPAIMSGHLNFPLITGNSDPASLSPYFLTDILRNRMNFDGITITDDMKMYGVRQEGNSIPEVCELALRAGNDMIMISRPPEIQFEVREHLLAQMSADPGFRAAVRESAERIIRTKLQYLKSGGSRALYPNPDDVESKLPDSEGRSFFFDLAYRSTTLISGANLPIDSNRSEKVLLAGYYSEFFAEGSAKYPQAGTYVFNSSSPGSREYRELLTAARDYDRVIFCLANKGTLQLLERLEGLREKLAVLSILTPVYFRDIPWIETAVAVYGTGIDSFKAGFAALAGDFTPQGTLPISLDPAGK